MQGWVSRLAGVEAVGVRREKRLSSRLTKLQRAMCHMGLCGMISGVDRLAVVVGGWVEKD